MLRRPMPRGWKNPLSEPLFCVVVDWRGMKGSVVVTPAVIQSVAEDVKAVIAAEIACGNKPYLSNPSVILCHA